jgi:site-specific recombinase XerD
VLSRQYKSKDIQIISITAKKTDKQTIIPVKPIVRKILDKYTTDGVLLMPRAISNQKMNDYIKDVVKAVGIKQTVEIVVSESGRTKTKIFEKWQLVSSHTCRRSFATNALLSGMEKQRIMNITGHSKEKDFDSYVCLTREELSILSSDDLFFM